VLTTTVKTALKLYYTWVCFCCCLYRRYRADTEGEEEWEGFQALDNATYERYPAGTETWADAFPAVFNEFKDNTALTTQVLKFMGPLRHRKAVAAASANFLLGTLATMPGAVFMRSGAGRGAALLVDSDDEDDN